MLRETKKGGKEILYDSYKYHRRKIIIFTLLIVMSFAVGITCIVVICRKGYRQKSVVDMFRQFKRDYGKYYDGDR